MENEIRASLTELKLLPIGEGRWKKVDFCIYSDSTKEQFDEARRKILDYVPHSTKGIYVLIKGEEVLYIGESGSSIQKRMMRHIDKIYSRTDERSTFFKQPQNQGDLTYYYFELPLVSSTYRKLIEESMNIVVKPTYLDWTLHIKSQRLQEILSSNTI